MAVLISLENVAHLWPSHDLPIDVFGQGEKKPERPEKSRKKVITKKRNLDVSGIEVCIVKGSYETLQVLSEKQQATSSSLGKSAKQGKY